jgi:hypothetical protein
MRLNFFFNITAEPRFYEDIGAGEFSFLFEELMIGLTIVNTTEGVFQIQVDDVNAVYGGGSTALKGTGDLSFALDQVTTLIEAQMQSNPNNTIRMFVDLLLPQINGIIAASGCQADLGGLFMNWCAMEQPRFSNDDVVLFFKGEVTPDKDTDIPFQEMRKVPYVFESVTRAIQVYISDYTLNTTLWSAYKKGMLTYDLRYTNETTQEPITAGMLSLLFPKITDHMDASTPISLKATASSDLTPWLQIDNGDTTAYAKMDISFATVDEQGNRSPFIEMTSNVTVEVDFEVVPPFTFTTDIKQMRIRADKLSLDKFDLTNIRDFNSIIGTASGFIRNLINRELRGIRVHDFNIGNLVVNVQATNMFEKHRYIYGDMSPHFEHKNEAEIPTLEDTGDLYSFKKVTYDDKVKAVANLLKLTPLYASIEEFKKNRQVLESIQEVGGLVRPASEREYEESYPMEREFDPMLEVKEEQI